MVWVAVLFFLGGLGLLVLGAELLVRGASRLAATFRVSPLAIGLTVVAFGTSAPEFVVSGVAALEGEGALAVGNVAGSNLFNLLVVLGFAALVRPLAVHASIIRKEVPLLVVVGLIVWGFAFGGFGRLEGAILVVGLIVYTFVTFRVSSQTHRAAGVQAVPHEGDEADRSWRRRLVMAGAVVAGVFLLVLGGRLAIEGALQAAKALGLSNRIVGVILLAAGTSLPELTTSIVAAARRQGDLAVGNVVGSNLFNLLGVLGFAAVVRPMEVSAAMLGFDLPVMALAPVVIFPLLWSGHRISRWEGALFLALYLAFAAFLLL